MLTGTRLPVSIDAQVEQANSLPKEAPPPSVQLEHRFDGEAPLPVDHKTRTGGSQGPAEQALASGKLQHVPGRRASQQQRGRHQWWHSWRQDEPLGSMVPFGAVLLVLGVVAAAAVAPTVDGVLVMGQDGRWSSSELVSVGQRTALLLLGSRLPEGPGEVGVTSREAPRGGSCEQHHVLPLPGLDSNGSASVVLPWRGRWYICLRQGNSWIHQGSAVNLNVAGDPEAAVVSGLRSATFSVSEDGVLLVPTNEELTLVLLGTNFSEHSNVSLTKENATRGNRCQQQALALSDLEPLHGGLAAKARTRLTSAGRYRLCVSRAGHWIHQGSDALVTLEAQDKLIPVWVHVVLICVLLVWSGLFSGLTLGLMALDKTELKVIESCGTPEEREYARKILPLRHRGNYLLCSLVLGNVCVNSSFTILLDAMLSSGPVAIVLSTLGIVLLGEIIPQAICSRYGLAIGARTILITKLFMVLTFPLSWPISKVLDLCLGEEIGSVFDREKLTEYLRITKDYADLENEELNIIFGALELTKKTAADVMTRIEDVYMVPYSAVLDFETMSEIVKRGYTRIPVFEGSKQNIVSLLNTKDLAFVDPDDAIPLKTLCRFYNHPLSFVFEDETLDSLLREFKKGHSHMAFVRHVVQCEDRDPVYNITGLVTLEDVIEEIIQSEIIDETDVLMDNRRKQRRKDAQLLQDFSDFLKIGGGQQGKNVVSAQLAFATFQFLSTAVRPFTAEFVTPIVLRRLMAQNIFFTIKPSAGKSLFDAGKQCDYFAVVLEGRVRVTVGKENLVFEAGPFSYYGLPALTADKGSFVPDYTITPLSYVVYMKVGHGVYVAALRASRMCKTDDPADVMLQESICQFEEPPKQTPSPTADGTDHRNVSWSEPATA